MKYWLVKFVVYSAGWYLVICAIVLLLPLIKCLSVKENKRIKTRLKKKYPFLNELNEGQVITVELKNGEILSDVIFLDYIKSEMLLGTETEFNNELEKYEVSEIRWIKLKKVVSVLPQAD